MKPASRHDLKRGTVYRGWTGKNRRIDSISPMGTVTYTPIVSGGRFGKPKECWISTFLEWVVDESSTVEVETT